MDQIEALVLLTSKMFAKIIKLVEASNLQAQLSDALLERISAQQKVIDALVRKVGELDTEVSDLTDKVMKS